MPDSGLPHIPSPPRSGGVTPQGGPPGGGGNDDVDLDDLTRRFEELKKRKWTRDKRHSIHAMQTRLTRSCIQLIFANISTVEIQRNSFVIVCFSALWKPYTECINVNFLFVNAFLLLYVFLGLRYFISMHYNLVLYRCWRYDTWSSRYKRSLGWQWMASWYLSLAC